MEEFHPLPVIYYPLVEYVHILVQLICAQFKSDMTKDNGYTGCENGKVHKNSDKDFSNLYVIVVLVQCLKCHHILSGILVITY